MAHRRRRILAGLVAVSSASAVSAPVAPASAGGATVPPQTGGAGGPEYGSPLASSGRPVAVRFAVAPGRVVAGGRLPSIRLRLDEAGVSEVRAHIVLRHLGAGGGELRVVLGGVRTGRTLRPTLPAGTVLVAGRYSILVHAIDPAGHALRRRPHHPGRATLTVVAPTPKRQRPAAHAAPAPARSPLSPAPARPTSAPAPPPRAAAPPPPTPVAVSTAAGRFPVAGPHTYGDGFGVGRVGHLHQGVDIFGAQGLQIVAPLAGTVRFTDYQAHGAGEYVVVHATTGADFFFAHCVRGSTAVTPGQAVAAGGPLCRLGTTGDAHGAHLHFEIWPNGWRTGTKGSVPTDPLGQLRAWDR